MYRLRPGPIPHLLFCTRYWWSALAKGQVVPPPTSPASPADWGWRLIGTPRASQVPAGGGRGRGGARVPSVLPGRPSLPPLCGGRAVEGLEGRCPAGGRLGGVCLSAAAVTCRQRCRQTEMSFVHPWKMPPTERTGYCGGDDIPGRSEVSVSPTNSLAIKHIILENWHPVVLH